MQILDSRLIVFEIGRYLESFWIPDFPQTKFGTNSYRSYMFGLSEMEQTQLGFLDKTQNTKVINIRQSYMGNIDECTFLLVLSSSQVNPSIIH